MSWNQLSQSLETIVNGGLTECCQKVTTKLLKQTFTELIELTELELTELTELEMANKRLGKFGGLLN